MYEYFEKYLQKIQEYENFSKRKDQKNLEYMENKTCRMMAEFAEENKIFNFFKRKNNSLKKN